MLSDRNYKKICTASISCALAISLARAAEPGGAQSGLPEMPSQSAGATSGLLQPIVQSVPLAAASQPQSTQIAQSTQPALGAGEEAPASPASAVPAVPKVSQNLTLNLIQRMVQRGLLTKEDAAELIKQAESDTVQAQAQAAAEQKLFIQEAVNQAMASSNSIPTGLEPGAGEDSMRVTYVPEVVKAQIRDQIKQEVLDQARDEHWVAPTALPGWVSRFRLTGDIRVRGESLSFPGNNDNTGAFPNFNSINTGAPFDIAGNQFSPQYNVDQDRTRIRLRARVGAEVDLGDNFTAGMRIATGENNSPVSTNQSFGLANQGQGGNFSKYSLWLDRAFVKYDLGAQPSHDFSMTIGRMDNPFFTTSEIIWDDDLGFDGLAAHAHYQVFKGFTPFINGGAFPVFNTDFNFANNQPAKFKSTDKWLYGIQGGAGWRFAKNFELKLAAAYYYFDGVEGKLSSPFTPLTTSDQGDTDNTRPSFAQKGNTYRPLRNIVPTADNNYGTSYQYQYFGLATPFHEMALTGRLTYDRYEPCQVSLFGEYVQNLAFNASDINAIAVNNRGATSAVASRGSFAGGDSAWIVGLKFGHPVFEKFGDWNVGLNYRHVESDAVVDGFTDSDFGLGGTNLKGYSVQGGFALGQRVSLGIRWMSADSIAGPPFKNDTLQVDFNAKF